jgi:hypothetical protein
LGTLFLGQVRFSGNACIHIQNFYVSLHPVEYAPRVGVFDGVEIAIAALIRAGRFIPDGEHIVFYGR